MELMFVHTYTRLETTWTSLKMTSSSHMGCNWLYLSLSVDVFFNFFLISLFIACNGDGFCKMLNLKYFAF